MIKDNRIMGREPAVFFGSVAAVLLAVIRFVPFTPEVSGALNALVLAGAGLATAWLVDREKALPALLGLTTAVFAVFLAYGSPVPESTQTGILELITIGVTLFIRQNVTAPVTGSGVSLLEHLHDAYAAGIRDQREHDQDDAVPADDVESTTSRVEDAPPLPDLLGQSSAPRSIARPGETSGPRAHTDIMPAVRDEEERRS